MNENDFTQDMSHDEAMTKGTTLSSACGSECITTDVFDKISASQSIFNSSMDRLDMSLGISDAPGGLTLSGTPAMGVGAVSKTPISKQLVKSLGILPRVTGFKGMSAYTNLERVTYMRMGGSSGMLSKFWGSNLMRTGASMSSVGFGLDATGMLLDFNSFHNSSSYRGLGGAEQFNYQNVGPSPIGQRVVDWWNRQ